MKLTMKVCTGVKTYSSFLMEKYFIDELTLLINDWNYETERQHVALKAFFVQTVGLQKPGPNSKAKEHQECLKNRLEMWEKAR